MNRELLRILATCIIATLMVVVISCTEMPTQTESTAILTDDSVENNTDSKNGSINTIDWSSWDDPGIIHNRCMEVLGDSLDSFDSTRFSNYGECKSWVLGIVSDFLEDSLAYDIDDMDSCMSYAMSASPTYTNFTFCIDTLLTLNKISSNEETWFYRLADILFTWNLTTSQLDDSLNSFANDAESASWTNDETLCPTVAAIAIYSWNLQNSTWTSFPYEQPNMPGTLGFDWVECGKSDVQGAIKGGIAGGFLGSPLKGAVGGAVGFSAADAVGQLTGWW